MPVVDRAAWRASEESAAELVAAAVPDETGRRRVLGLLAECIELAHGASPGSWVTTLDPQNRGFGLNVGQDLILYLDRGEGWFAVQPPRMRPSLLGRIESVAVKKGQYKRPADLAWFVLRRHDFDAVFEEIAPRVREAALRAADAARASSFSNSHSVGLVAHIRSVTGRPLPDAAAPPIQVALPLAQPAEHAHPSPIEEIEQAVLEQGTLSKDQIQAGWSISDDA